MSKAQKSAAKSQPAAPAKPLREKQQQSDDDDDDEEEEEEEEEWDSSNTKGKQTNGAAAKGKQSSAKPADAASGKKAGAVKATAEVSEEEEEEEEEEESDEEEELPRRKAAAPAKKAAAAATPAAKKETAAPAKKKQLSSDEDESEDDESEEEEIRPVKKAVAAAPAAKKTAPAPAKKKVESDSEEEESEEEEEEDESEEEESDDEPARKTVPVKGKAAKPAAAKTAKAAPVKAKSAFAALDDEEDEDESEGEESEEEESEEEESEEEEEEQVKPSKPAPKKAAAAAAPKKAAAAKGKQAKAKPAADDDIDQLLAAIEKPKKGGKQQAAAAAAPTTAAAQAESRAEAGEAAEGEERDESKMSKAALKRLKQKQKAEAEKKAEAERAARGEQPPAPAAAAERKEAKVEEKKEAKAEEKKAAAAGAGKKESKAVLALKEKLRQQKEEEEKRVKEEEERRRAEEEEARRLEEEEKRAAEEKERRKAERAEKKEQLRKEGKLLTKAEKEKQRKAQMFIEQLKAQGLPVPDASEHKDEKTKKPKYGARVRKEKGGKGKEGAAAETKEGEAGEEEKQQEAVEEVTAAVADLALSPTAEAAVQEVAAAGGKKAEKDGHAGKAGGKGGKKGFGKATQAQLEAQRIREATKVADEQRRKEREEQAQKEAEAAKQQQAEDDEEARRIQQLEDEAAALAEEEEAEAEPEEEEEEDEDMSWDMDEDEKEELRKKKAAEKKKKEAENRKQRAEKEKKLAELADAKRKREEEEGAASEKRKVLSPTSGAGAAAGGEKTSKKAASSPTSTSPSNKSSEEDSSKAAGKKDLRSPICCILGHVDTGKCWAPGTQLRLYDGELKAVETFVGGEQLMGSDGLPRTVTPGSVTTGQGCMYRIVPKDESARPFVVNGPHILVLTINDRPRVDTVSTSHSTNSRCVRWYELEKNQPRLRTQVCADEAEADSVCATKLAGWRPITWRVSVDQFRASPAWLTASCKMFASGAVTFQPRSDALHLQLAAILGVAPTRQQLDWAAWYLGLWLTAGTSTSASISHSDRRVMDCLYQYETLFGEQAMHVSTRLSTTDQAIHSFKPAASTVAHRLLHSYGVINSQHIPQAWICDTLQVRRCILAGALDGAGRYDEQTCAFAISMKRNSLGQQLNTLAGSLGLRCGEPLQDSGGCRIRISGHLWPVAQHSVLTHKQCPQPGHPGYIANTRDSRSFDFDIQPLPVGAYHGFAVHGGRDRQLLLSDFTVTHNTKLLDKIRSTNVQEHEAGGITQQIGATYFPADIIRAKTAAIAQTVKKEFVVNVPGLLVIDTPGHESFNNLRSRGSGLCDIAILVVDIMHGLEPQTIESINLLKMRKTPFVVALNKIDRCYAWAAQPNAPFRQTLAQQPRGTQDEFDKRAKEALTALTEQGMNVALWYENTDFRKYVSVIPTSAITGEGIPDLLMLLIQLTQTMMNERLGYLSELQCTVLEVKVVEGHGTTIDVVLVNGILNEGETIVVCGLQGPIVTSIRALLTPPPMMELRIKSEYVHNKSVKAAIGVKISAPGLEQAIAGSQLLVYRPSRGPSLEELKDEVQADLASVLSKVDKSGQGVCVQASTLGSLEALLSFLSDMKIPVSGISIGPVYRKDVMRASIMLEKKHPEYAVILAFDVKVAPEADKLAADLGVTIFTADIIYHLYDKVTAYMNKAKEDRRVATADVAVFPVVLDVLPNCVFMAKNPLLLGCRIVEGQAKLGTPLCVPVKEKLFIGRITGLQKNHEDVKEAKKGDEVAVKIEMDKGGPNIIVGRQFDQTHQLVSRLSRESIDQLKANFKEDLTDDDWRLVIKLKKLLEIM